MKYFKTGLLAAALLAISLSSAFAASGGGGNELMYQKIQDLDTIAGSAVSSTADYSVVYNAATNKTKKVLALGASTAKTPVTLAVTTVLDSTYCGKTLLMNGAGGARTFTLPAATGTGCHMRFIVAAVNTSNYIITHAGSDIIKGGLVFGSDNASNAELGFETQTAVTVTLNGTSTGGAGIGDEIEIDDIGAAVWTINGRVTESGSETTPFS